MSKRGSSGKKPGGKPAPRLEKNSPAPATVDSARTAPPSEPARLADGRPAPRGGIARRLGSWKVWLGPLLLLALVGVAAADAWRVSGLPERPQKFVGGQSCVSCHAAETTAWRKSNHDLAMSPATPEHVLGDFNDRSIEHYGLTSRMRRRGDQYVITTEGPTGKVEDFPVAYTFGVRPLQQYLVEMPGGRLHAVNVAWNTDKKEWFLLDPEDQKIEAHDVLHWTGRGMNWNHMCADCHSTNVHKGFDPVAQKYHTTYSDANVNCEACHGPGDAHLAWANSHSLFFKSNDPRLPELAKKDVPVPQRTPDDSQALLTTCGTCHARRQTIAAGFKAGDAMLDHYIPELLDSNVYHPDGQIRPEEEAFEYGSYLQSKMYRKGIRCNDCHQPHSGKLLAEDNKLCTKCHTPERYDVETHHHHKLDSKGARCVECHMPESTYMEVDPRRDHSIRIPRPDLSLTLGTPNACVKCHDKENEGNAWAAEKIRSWHPSDVHRRPHWGETIHAGRAAKPEALATLIALAKPKTGDADVGPFVRASALAILGRQYGGDAADHALLEGARDKDDLVRYAATSGLQGRGVPVPNIAPLLTDPRRAVRIAAAQALVGRRDEIDSADVHDALADAVAEFRASLEYHADQPAAHYQLAQLRLAEGKDQEALREFETTLALDPLFQIAREPLAELYLRAGRATDAEKLLRDGVAQAPEQGEPRFVLAKLLASDPERLKEAVAEFAEAAKRSPTTARYQYNLGVALEQLQQWPAAADALATATRLDPSAADAWHALAIAQRRLERWGDLQKTAAELLARSPDEPIYQHLHGLALLRLGEVASAERDLTGASRVAEQSPDVAITLAELCEAKGDWKTAVIYTRLARSLAPQDLEVQRTAARIEQAALKAGVDPTPRPTNAPSGAGPAGIGPASGPNLPPSVGPAPPSGPLPPGR